MLVIFYGTSCVGKTTLMNYLRCCHNWKMISVYMTRPTREDETEKKQVDVEYLIRGEKSGDFLPLNQCYGIYYGTPIKELEMAEADRENIWCLDFPLERKQLFNKYKYCGIIILPQDKAQLVQQIYKAKRTERLEKILFEYENQYADVSKLNLYTIVNYPNRIRHTCDEILKLINDYRRITYGNII